ncbi:MAG: SCP2 sterol-binding domain-containing protein [Lachnospiraceae bacterium]|nr:SCP2 sterol-binding domain-containing protein [Lachnospiraceae bacterium]
MKYEEIVAKVKKAYAKADTALVDEHLAVQVDVTGEGEGAFYIEVADGKINVEPWEYLDHDFKIQCTAEEIIAIAEGKKKLGAEVESGNVYISRNFDKVAVFDLIVAKKAAAKKPAAKKAEPAKKAEKKPAKKETVKAEKAPKAKKETAKAPKAEAPADKKKPGRKPKTEAKAVEAPKAAEAAEVKAPVEKKKPGRKAKAAEVKA